MCFSSHNDHDSLFFLTHSNTIPNIAHSPPTYIHSSLSPLCLTSFQPCRRLFFVSNSLLLCFYSSNVKLQPFRENSSTSVSEKVILMINTVKCSKNKTLPDWNKDMSFFVWHCIFQVGLYYIEGWLCDGYTIETLLFVCLHSLSCEGCKITVPE